MIARRAEGEPPGVILFLTAGDPPGEELVDLLLACDDAAIAAVELAVPFPGSPTDGPAVHRSADRALAASWDLDATLELVRRARPRMARTRVVLLADWSWSLADRTLSIVMEDIRDAGADALLVHGLPRDVRARVTAAASEACLPLVTTCFHGMSRPSVLRQAADETGSYVYLVSRFGRTGGSAPLDVPGLTQTVAQLRAHRDVPVAIGFGVRGAAEVAAVAETGADAAIIGSAAVLAVEQGRVQGDLPHRFRRFLRDLSPGAIDEPPSSGSSSR